MGSGHAEARRIEGGAEGEPLENLDTWSQARPEWWGFVRAREGSVGVAAHFGV